ncbi:GAF domain-containing protein [Haliea salexigens]|uniref:GAF domain-containing protein n=1 Tax=Haliea salexigens TaxID=287487 RepID=UPI000555141F|nr:GAF domain-containing protein [Haliea salexigens]MAA87372.1 diguanylate cyclase [Haliea sp.]|tara:strand:+ start:9797 stop:10459 length:663 start_codon:yes stop_codon:yes gene_type:complete
MKSVDESQRLRELLLYRVMDTSAERVFDSLTEIASTICEAPISLISLVDDSRQWFKSRVGLSATETPREHAFCAHALDRRDLLVVEDATQDERFRNNPLVVNDPGIRFYAGAPLEMASGATLGTLCVIDRVPRQLTDVQRRSLEVLRDAVVAQLELRRYRIEMQSLQSLVPICAWCREVRVSDSSSPESWVPLHDFVADATPVTHTICPACSKRESGVTP